MNNFEKMGHCFKDIYRESPTYKCRDIELQLEIVYFCDIIFFYNKQTFRKPTTTKVVIKEKGNLKLIFHLQNSFTSKEIQKILSGP